MSRSLYAIPHSKGVYVEHSGTFDQFISSIRNACEVHEPDMVLDKSHLPALETLERVLGNGDGSGGYAKIIELISTSGPITLEIRV